MVPEPGDGGQIELVVRGVHDVEALADRLHHAVFDPVVDHLDVVAGSGGTAVQVARFGRQGLDRRFEALEDLALATDHRAEPNAQPPDPATDAHVEPFEAVLLDHRGPTLAVMEVRVPRVDDHIPALENSGQLPDHLLGRIPGRDADDHETRAGHRGAQLLEGIGDGDTPSVLRLGGQVVGDLRVPVPGHHLVPALGKPACHPRSHASESRDGNLHRSSVAPRPDLCAGWPHVLGTTAAPEAPASTRSASPIICSRRSNPDLASPR